MNIKGFFNKLAKSRVVLADMPSNIPFMRKPKDPPPVPVPSRIFPEIRQNPNNQVLNPQTKDIPAPKVINSPTTYNSGLDIKEEVATIRQMNNFINNSLREEGITRGYFY